MGLDLKKLNSRKAQNICFMETSSKLFNKIETQNLKFWGHNCFSIESKSSVLLIDPWFSEKGAFFSSWFQYPKNNFFKDDVLKLLSKKINSFIFISHEHEDHLDENFLKSIPSKTNLIIPNYFDKTLKKIISKYTQNIIECNDNDELYLNSEIKILLKISDVGVNNDASILINTEEFSFFNQNDCKIFDRLSEIKQDITFYSAQFSGANAHPSTFIFSEEKKIELSNNKVNAKLNNVLKGIKTLKPSYFLPAAGPAIFPFLDSDLSLGKNNIFIHQDYLNKFLLRNGVKNIIYLKPGNFFKKKYVDPIPPPTLEEISSYKEGIFNTWDQISNNLDRNALEKSILDRFAKIEDIKLKNCPILIFNYSGFFNENDSTRNYKIFIDLNTKTLLKDFDYSSSFMEIISSKKYFNLMTCKRWQNVSLSFKAKVVVKPDQFSNDLNLFLFSDLSNIRNNFITTKKRVKERIIVESKNGRCFKIDKYCPHQKANLSRAELNKNELICPAHGWKFDLEKNGLDKQSNLSINAEEINAEVN